VAPTAKHRIRCLACGSVREPQAFEAACETAEAVIHYIGGDGGGIRWEWQALSAENARIMLRRLRAAADQLARELAAAGVADED
jgi:hypothetical protein